MYRSNFVHSKHGYQFFGTPGQRDYNANLQSLGNFETIRQLADAIFALGNEEA